jgi:hypothetical protein
MKRYVLGIVLMTLLVPTAVCCGEFEEIAEREEFERQMEHRQMEQREREMELENRDAEMSFQREMRQLELEERRANIEREREHAGHREHHGKKEAGPLLLFLLVVHILVAVWVYTDIRKLNSGSGIWIVIALLTGLLGTLVYAVVRMGDVRTGKS